MQRRLLQSIFCILFVCREAGEHGQAGHTNAAATYDDVVLYFREEARFKNAKLALESRAHVQWVTNTYTAAVLGALAVERRSAECARTGEGDVRDQVAHRGGSMRMTTGQGSAGRGG